MKVHGFHGNPSWILKNEGVWGSQKEQFGAHEKLSWGGGVHGTLHYLLVQGIIAITKIFLGWGGGACKVR